MIHMKINDFWLTSVSGTSPMKIGYSLTFPLIYTDEGDYGMITGIVKDVLECCQKSGELQKFLNITAKEQNVEPISVQGIQFENKVKPNRGG